MSRRILVFVGSLIILISLMGCDVKEQQKVVMRITYSVDSGPVLPELQMIEKYEIKRDGVKLTRSGKIPDTQVFEGEWAFTTEKEKLDKLFRTAEQKCSALKRVEPADPPDGGNTVIINLVYADDSECTLTYDPGVNYECAENLLADVHAVIETLKTLPGVVVE